MKHQALTEAWEHGCVARQHDVSARFLVDSSVALHDPLGGSEVEYSCFCANETSMEQPFCAMELSVTKITRPVGSLFANPWLALTRVQLPWSKTCWRNARNKQNEEHLCESRATWNKVGLEL